MDKLSKKEIFELEIQSPYTSLTEKIGIVVVFAVCFIFLFFTHQKIEEYNKHVKIKDYSSILSKSIVKVEEIVIPSIEEVTNSFQKEEAILDLSQMKALFSFQMDGKTSYSFENFDFFAQSSYTLSSKGKRKLREMKEFLKDQNFLISAHTDPVQPMKRKYRRWNTNEKLAELRAKSIRNYLLKLGVSEKRMTVVKGRKIKKNDREGERAVTFIIE